MNKDFPLGHAKSFTCWRMVTGVMLAVILLPVALASAGYAYTNYELAQIPTPADVEALANKSVSYWLVALALFSISSWTFIVRWLLNQLMEQRAASTKATSELISYMKEDRTNQMILMTKVSALLEKLTNK